MPINVKELDHHIIDQLPNPFTLMGNFNSHHTLWGCANTNDKGQIIEDFIIKHDLVLLNDKSSTHLHHATGSRSSFDLTICRPSVQQRSQRWKLHKADWEQFRVHCEQTIHPNAFED